MKRNFTIGICVLLLTIVFPSCKNYLEKPVSSDVTVDDVFSSKDKTEEFFVECI